MDKEKLDKALTLRMMLDTNLNALSRAIDISCSELGDSLKTIVRNDENLESSLYNLYTIHTTVCKKNLMNLKIGIMEPMVTISVKDYNELVRNSGDKRVLELLTIIVNYATQEQEKAWVTRTRFDAIDMLRKFIKELQSGEQSFEEIMEWTKRGLSNESTEENKEGSEAR